MNEDMKRERWRDGRWKDEETERRRDGQIKT
jgi:hypothetical protein